MRIASWSWTSRSAATCVVSSIAIRPISPTTRANYNAVHISKSAPFSEKVVRIWTAELASAVEYLHRQRIIHRDIKPDNILLDEQGHVHLTDFNVAMHFSSRRLHTSVGGSLAYMAPEMLSKRTASSGERKPTGYTWCVDWWSLGVTVFEMLYGRRPYEGKTATVMKQSIVAGEARYGGVPGTNIQLSAACLDVLHGFLERDPFRRLGCRPNGQGLTDVQQHAWFAGLDWAALPSKAVPSAYVPDPKEANFDPTHELDEFLMLEKPLAKRSRKEGVDIEKMSPERRELELEFTVYDFSAMQRMTYFPPDDGKSRAPSPATVAPRPSTQSARPNRQTSGQSQSPVPGLRPNSSDTALDTNFDDGASLVPTATILENRSVTVMAHAQPVNPQLQETPPPLPSLLTTPGSSSMRVPQR
jgi:serine/threonine kinase 32